MSMSSKKKDSWYNKRICKKKNMNLEIIEELRTGMNAQYFSYHHQHLIDLFNPRTQKLLGKY